MIILGMLIGDRYEILDKIGTGGMSDVYKAKDHKLNRFVAVKVLKNEFSENTNFVSKFRVEAQAAAGLMHPNIVNVYDVGEEDGIYYIVMELVEGITLKNYIEKKSRLSIKEAISIAIQVSMGIEAAHNNHIIHRDIKPQNIIISKDGKVKVTDFGIAKAATSNTITSNVMGSVHYTSPEQARGGFSDEKSDIYSLGCTMFEMLTGHVPFDGETTVAIAIKHIQEEMPSPREYVPEIPVSIEKIILKCTQKSPDRRYQKMGDLITDLKRSLLYPNDDFVEFIDPDISAATKAISEEDVAEIKEKIGVSVIGEEHMRLKEETAPKRPVKAVQILEDEEDEDEDEDDEYEDDDDMDPKMERVTTILAIVAAVIIGIIALVLVANAVGIFKGKDKQQEEQTEQVEMVNVVGMEVEVAKVTLDELYLDVTVEYKESDDTAENVVMEQSVKEGEMVSPQSKVTLTVSSGTASVDVPDVLGMTEDAAYAKLKEAGFKVATENGYSDEVDKGYVMSQNPEGDTKAAVNALITIIISQGAEVAKVDVPDLRGLSESAAKDKLGSVNLKAGTVTEEYSDSVTEGCVISQSYSPGMEVDEQTAVSFVLSLGKKAVTYNYTASIPAPSGFVEGDTVTITITAADGTSQTYSTSTFPYDVNLTGLKSANGTVSYTGVRTTQVGTGTMDENGAEIMENVNENVNYGSAPVNFTQAN